MERKHTMEKLITLREFSYIRTCGNSVGYLLTENHSEKGKPPRTEVKILSGDGKNVRNNMHPETGASIGLFDLSPASDRFAFIETKDDVHILNTGTVGKDWIERTILPGEPSQLKWFGDSILLLMKERLDPGRKEEIEKGNDGVFFEEDLRYSSIYQYRPGQELKILTQGVQVWEFTSSGKSIAYVGSDNPHENSWYESRLSVIDTETGKVKTIYDPEPRTLTRPVFSPDAEKIAFLVSHWSDRGETGGDVYVLDVKTGVAENITKGLNRSYDDILFSEDGRIHALYQESAMFGISIYDGKWNDLWSATGSIQPGFAPEFRSDGNNYYVGFSDAHNPPEIYSVDSSGRMKVLTGENEHLVKLKAQPYEIVSWKSKDGREIQGILKCTRPDMPLIVYIHGGPTSSSTVDFIDMSTVLLDSGFAVFMPNYRGSTGFGREFAEANIGDMGGRDLEDILTGIEYLKKSGKTSAKKLFITGGSYGGYIVDLAIGRTDMFSAAASLFGISSWESFHGMSNIPVWDTLYYDKSVYSEDSPHARFDPIREVESIKTPLLLIHGISDPVVPVGQSFEMHRKMKETGKTVRLLLFPREGHGFSEKYHRIKAVEEMVKWFSNYLE